MYIYDFLKDNEHAINERCNVLVNLKHEIMDVNVILTNKNLLLFCKTYDKFYEVICKFSLSNLNYHNVDNDTIISSNSNIIKLVNFNLDEFIKL